MDRAHLFARRKVERIEDSAAVDVVPLPGFLEPAQPGMELDQGAVGQLVKVVDSPPLLSRYDGSVDRAPRDQVLGQQRIPLMGE
ncbi:MAG TPA: hypothetical protein P5333_06500, partial [Caldilinea sp.]|nr:hypothetical protein [Caldilinea sp.]